jgi:Flp pilus assembly pilin Flp
MLANVVLRLFFAIQGIGTRAGDESGQTLAEYSLIVTVIAVGTVTLSVIVFRDTLSAAFNSTLPCLRGLC